MLSLELNLSNGRVKCLYTHETWIGFHCGMAFEVSMHVSGNFCSTVMESLSVRYLLFVTALCLFFKLIHEYLEN